MSSFSKSFIRSSPVAVQPPCCMNCSLLILRNSFRAFGLEQPPCSQRQSTRNSISLILSRAIGSRHLIGVGYRSKQDLPPFAELPGQPRSRLPTFTLPSRHLRGLLLRPYRRRRSSVENFVICAPLSA